MFLKLMDANADTIETHFSLGSLYRRRGEVERAIRIHENLLARATLATEHREQALLALAHDYLRAGLIDRAEALLRQVSEVPRLRPHALNALRGVYERQREWRQALSDAPKLMHEELAHLLQLVGPAGGDAMLADLAAQTDAEDPAASKRLVFAALSAGVADAPSLVARIETVFAQDRTLRSIWRSGDGPRIAQEIGVLLARTENYRCLECGFAARNIYWHCPACHAWDSFEPYALVKLG